MVRQRRSGEIGATATGLAVGVFNVLVRHFSRGDERPGIDEMALCGVAYPPKDGRFVKDKAKVTCERCRRSLTSTKGVVSRLRKIRGAQRW